MEQPHSGKARLGDLRRADRVIGARGLAPPGGIERGVAAAEMNEVRLHPVGDPEIEMAAVDLLEEARRAEVVIVAGRIDIGPERARVVGHAGFARQIGATLDQRRGEAEIETEQGRRGGGLRDQPLEHFGARPHMPGTDQARRIIPPRLADRDALVALALRPRPVDRDGARETGQAHIAGGVGSVGVCDVTRLGGAGRGVAPEVRRSA